jgi:Saccharopine dehydrogenase C-terminal domain
VRFRSLLSTYDVNSNHSFGPGQAITLLRRRPRCLQPLDYKFSSSSRGVLISLFNDASYISSHRTLSAHGSQLMAAAQPYFISPIYAFVAYPNRAVQRVVRDRGGVRTFVEMGWRVVGRR